MTKPNLCIAHSGGVTAILNTTAAASIRAARASGNFNTIYAAEFGLNGLIHGRLFDTSHLTESQLTQLSQTPSSVFGSCRYKLKSYADDPQPYQAIYNTCKQANIQYLLYQGGNDSQDTTLKLSQAQSHFNHKLNVLGLPKTIDNDLHGTDFCPGYPSAAKYLATSIQEAALDTWAMSRNSTQVFILEVMGRHTGWLAMATGVARHDPAQAPHCILTPERAFDQQHWLNYVQHCVEQYGFCVVVAAEGITDSHGQRLVTSTEHDAFGHAQLGGVGQTLANMVRQALNLKVHWALPDYLQRSAGHIRAGTDTRCAEQLGTAGVQALLDGQNNCMLGLQRLNDDPHVFTTTSIDLQTCANLEKTVPNTFIDPENYLLSNSAKAYLQPLLTGEHYPAFKNGLPDYLQPQALTLTQIQTKPIQECT